MAENALFPDRKDLLNPSSLEGDEVKEHTDIADIFAAEMLSAQVNNVPTQLNVELGVFWKGSFVKDKGNLKYFLLTIFLHHLTYYYLQYLVFLIFLY